MNVTARDLLRPHRLALATILALSAFLNTYKISQNAWGNTFYSSGVKSMLGSLHNFLFVSFDQGGLVTIDKPPLGIWPQAVSAKLFGFTPLSLLLPEALIGTLTVGVLYLVLARRLGVLAGLAGALALAVFPIWVAVSRDNGVDPMLVLLMLLACMAALFAIESGRWRSLLASAVLVGLAFNTKTLAAYLVVPGIALAYLVCAPGVWYRRTGKLVVAGIVMGAVSFSWIGLVELTPASQRPFVGSSTNNTEIGLTFEYNGLGRVEGEAGGPGHVFTRPGGVVRAPVHHTPHLSPAARVRLRAAAKRRAAAASSRYLPNGRYRNPVAFGGAIGPFRLFGAGLAGQGAWMLPFALLGLLALALSLLGGRDGRPEQVAAENVLDPGRRRDPRLAVLIALGGWMLVEFAVLSLSKGIVHPYYISALAPPAAAMIGAGVVAFGRFVADRDPRALLLPIAVVSTVVAQVAILHHQRYMQWFIPLLIVGAAVGLLIAALAMAIGPARGVGVPACAFLLGVLLIAPGAYSATTWLAPVEGTFPAAGPHEATGFGKFGIDATETRVAANLARYVDTHHPTARFSVLTDASPTAAPLILLGSHAAALGGYGGSDPILDGPSLAKLIAGGEARYVVLGGAYASRGGNRATAAVLHGCSQVPAAAWRGPVPGPQTLVLFDCAGREAQLTAAGP
ncbi:MAG TPA: glycosyltransferase family 39 protein [Solirubrobacteraceae bacterium]|jgi:4-amino-4-deoxy-L-arabinose transferase-like glycosyltransferase